MKKYLEPTMFWVSFLVIIYCLYNFVVFDICEEANRKQYVLDACEQFKTPLITFDMKVQKW